MYFLHHSNQVGIDYLSDVCNFFMIIQLLYYSYSSYCYTTANTTALLLLLLLLLLILLNYSYSYYCYTTAILLLILLLLLLLLLLILLLYYSYSYSYSYYSIVRFVVPYVVVVFRNFICDRHTLRTHCRRAYICSTASTSRSCLLYTSPSPRDGLLSRMPSSA